MKQQAPKRTIPLYDLTLAPSATTSVRSTLKSGWLTSGPKAAEFEKAIARKLKMRHVAAVNSGTAALGLSMATLGLGPGIEVVTTPFSFVATAETIMQLGATPVFADIDPETLNIDPDEVARKVTDKTGAIVPVDIAGLPADYDPLRRISEYHRVPVIADAAHSFGSTYKRKPTCKWVDAAAYSFHATKNLTCGEGGLVASPHKALTERVKLLSLHGLTSSGYDRKKAAEWRYDVVALGYKANLSDIHASVGLGQLERFDEDQAKRAKIAARYHDHLKDLDEFLVLPPEPRGYGHAWHLYIIRLHLSPLKIDRNRFIALMKQAGVECGVHYVPMFQLTLFRQLGLTEQFFPNAAYAGKRVVSLPMYPGLSLKAVDYVCEEIRSICKQYAR